MVETPRCKLCKELIEKEEYLALGDNFSTWSPHLAGFVCESCSRQLEEGPNWKVKEAFKRGRVERKAGGRFFSG